MKQTMLLCCLLIFLCVNHAEASNNALEFDGMDDVVQVPDSTDFHFATGAFTLEAWIKNTNTFGSAYKRIITKRGGAASWFSMVLNSNILKIEFNGGVGFSTGPAIQSDNQWHHVAATRDEFGAVVLYVDGTAYPVGNFANDIDNSEILEIGKWGGEAYGGESYRGQIDEVRIWNIARSSSEIQQKMDLQLYGDEPGLVAYYNFDENSGQTLPDLAGENDGTLVNMDDTSWISSTAPVTRTCFDLEQENPAVCSGYGICFDEDMCVCDDDYAGSACESPWSCFGVDPTDSGVCSGHGDCLEHDYCSCDEGYYGNNCDSVYQCFGTPATDASVCSGRGECIQQDSCLCNSDWHGSVCQIFGGVTCNGISHNNPEACGTNGVCTNEDSCSCYGGYHGVLCESHFIGGCDCISSLDPDVCGGHGDCIAQDTCQCDSTYSGTYCENNEWSCYGLESHDPFACTEGHGVCVSADTCVCNAGFKGTACQFAILPGYQCFDYLSEEPEVCSGRGGCVSDDSCSCDVGYVGEECQYVITCFGVDRFSPDVCSGHGTCLTPDNCACKLGWYGIMCDSPSAKSSSQSECPFVDNDNDTYSTPDDCDDDNVDVNPGMIDSCDGFNNDCDTETDEDFAPMSISCGLGVCVAGGETSCHYGVLRHDCVMGEPTGDDTDCDNIDDDCDGATDEDYASEATACGVGACASSGTMTCVEGMEVDNCTTGVPAGDDRTCDNIDDDCDGATDEDYASEATACGVGACASSGTINCVAGSEVDNCTAGVPAGDDRTCDSIDDDCDGATDEDYASEATACGVGACASSGTISCVAGSEVDNCTAGVPAGDDRTCDNIDDDCDGATDEDYASEATACGVGACASSGTMTCVEGMENDNCTTGVPSADDRTCDGVDDDCNGETDEDYVSEATACGVGACASSGTMTCVEGMQVDNCTTGVPAGDDSTCDNMDDDCDGATDEDYASEATACGVGACASSGTMTCVEGMENDNCTTGVPSADDRTCDGVDDDCNGETDEDYVSEATACGVGACASSGTMTCVEGMQVDNCTTGVPAGDDSTCDNMDDDCDGATDEDYASEATACGVGACASSGTMTCVEGMENDNCTTGVPSADDRTCDGIDDDCNGATDEDYVSEATACGVGACASSGTMTCVEGMENDNCTTGVPAGDELCDGIDDNCNGIADEDEVLENMCVANAACIEDTGVYACVCDEGYEAVGDNCEALPCTGNDDWTLCRVDGNELESACFEGQCETLAHGDSCFIAEELVLDQLYNASFEDAHAYNPIESPCVDGESIAGRDLYIVAALLAGHEYSITITNNTGDSLTAAMMTDCDDSNTCLGSMIISGDSEPYAYDLPITASDTFVFLHVVESLSVANSLNESTFSLLLEDKTVITDGDTDTIDNDTDAIEVETEQDAETETVTDGDTDTIDNDTDATEVEVEQDTEAETVTDGDADAVDNDTDAIEVEVEQDADAEIVTDGDTDTIDNNTDATEIEVEQDAEAETVTDGDADAVDNDTDAIEVEVEQDADAEIVTDGDTDTIDNDTDATEIEVEQDAEAETVTDGDTDTIDNDADATEIEVEQDAEAETVTDGDADTIDNDTDTTEVETEQDAEAETVTDGDTDTIDNDADATEIEVEQDAEAETVTDGDADTIDNDADAIEVEVEQGTETDDVTDSDADTIGGNTNEDGSGGGSGCSTIASTTSTAPIQFLLLLALLGFISRRRILKYS